jgi:hypothetical protein
MLSAVFCKDPFETNIPVGDADPIFKLPSLFENTGTVVLIGVKHGHGIAEDEEVNVC